MTKPSNIAAIEETTGTGWNDWTAYLDNNNGRELPHRAIADLAFDKLRDELENAGWWAQSIAVAYEQHIGRRLPGQRSDGTFESAVSKTVDGTMDDAMGIWLDYFGDQTDVDGVAVSGVPSATTPARGRHWAVNLADGSRLNADCYPKSDDKTSFTITHAKLTSPEAAERWRSHWKPVLDELHHGSSQASRNA